MGATASSIQPTLKEKRLTESDIHPKLLELFDFKSNCDQDELISLERIIALLSGKKDLFISFDLDSNDQKRISKINDFLIKKGIIYICFIILMMKIAMHYY